MNELRIAALDYADCLTEFHFTKLEQTPESDALHRKAYNKLCDAQNKLNALAVKQAYNLQ
jgi:hypothetical protein